MRIALDAILGISVVIATFLGPVIAVLITRWIDERRRTRDSRLAIFRSLMATRRAWLSPEKVTALNMVEIDFHGIKLVEDAYQEVVTHLNNPKISFAKDPKEWEDRHRKLLTKLLSEMAKVLGYKLQQLDMLDGGYYPQGLLNIELQEEAVRLALIQVLNGHRPLIISPIAPTPPAPFPPPPAPHVGNT